VDLSACRTYLISFVIIYIPFLLDRALHREKFLVENERIRKFWSYQSEFWLSQLELLYIQPEKFDLSIFNQNSNCNRILFSVYNKCYSHYCLDIWDNNLSSFNDSFYWWHLIYHTSHVLVTFVLMYCHAILFYLAIRNCINLSLYFKWIFNARVQRFFNYTIKL